MYRDYNTVFIDDSGWGTKDLSGDDMKYCQNNDDVEVKVTHCTSGVMTSAPPGAAASSRTDGWGLVLEGDCSFTYSNVDWAGIVAAGITDPFVVTIPNVTVRVNGLFYGPIGVTTAI